MFFFIDIILFVIVNFSIIHQLTGWGRTVPIRDIILLQVLQSSPWKFLWISLTSSWILAVSRCSTVWRRLGVFLFLILASAGWSTVPNTTPDLLEIVLWRDRSSFSFLIIARKSLLMLFLVSGLNFSSVSHSWKIMTHSSQRLDISFPSVPGNDPFCWISHI